MEAYELVKRLRYIAAEGPIALIGGDLLEQAADMIEQLAQRLKAAEAEPSIVRWARESSTKGCRHE